MSASQADPRSESAGAEEVLELWARNRTDEVAPNAAGSVALRKNPLKGGDRYGWTERSPHEPDKALALLLPLLLYLDALPTTKSVVVSVKALLPIGQCDE